MIFIGPQQNGQTLHVHEIEVTIGEGSAEFSRRYHPNTPKVPTYCHNYSPDGIWYCTMKSEHGGLHVATDGSPHNTKIIAIWGEAAMEWWIKDEA